MADDWYEIRVGFPAKSDEEAHAFYDQLMDQLDDRDVVGYVGKSESLSKGAGFGE